MSKKKTNLEFEQVIVFCINKLEKNTHELNCDLLVNFVQINEVDLDPLLLLLLISVTFDSTNVCFVRKKKQITVEERKSKGHFFLCLSEASLVEL